MELTSLLFQIDLESASSQRQTALKDFLTTQSQRASRVQCGSIKLWKGIDNHNRSNQRSIGKLKALLLRKRVKTISGCKPEIDLRLRSYLCR